MKKICFLLLALTAVLFSRSLEDIKNSGEIKIGVRSDLPPFSTLQDGNFTGFEISLAKEIGKDILGEKGEIIFVNINPADAITHLEDDKIDLIMANFSISKERESKIDFSIPYLLSDLRFLVNKDKKIQKLSQFDGKTILIVPGTEGDIFIQENPEKFSKVNLIDCYSLDECYERLQNNEADGYIDSIFTLANISVMNDNYIIPYEHVAEHAYMAVGIKKGNKALTDAVNKTIVKLSKEEFFSKAYDETFKPHYKDKIDKDHFLLDDVYKSFG